MGPNIVIKGVATICIAAATLVGFAYATYQTGEEFEAFGYHIGWTTKYKDLKAAFEKKESEIRDLRELLVRQNQQLKEFKNANDDWARADSERQQHEASAWHFLDQISFSDTGKVRSQQYDGDGPWKHPEADLRLSMQGLHSYSDVTFDTNLKQLQNHLMFTRTNGIQVVTSPKWEYQLSVEIGSNTAYVTVYRREKRAIQ